MDTEVASFLAFIIGASIAVPYILFAVGVFVGEIEDGIKAFFAIWLPIVITFSVVVGRLAYKLFMWLP